MKMFSLWENPISTEAPSGVDIEYDSRFLELQNAAEGKPEQQYGDTIIPAQEPEWSTVEKLCHQLLAESKDLRLFAYYGRVLTAKHGLPGFSVACESLKINLELFWETLYPSLQDEDGKYDPFYRINALSPFSLPDGIAKELLSSKLLVNGLTQQPVTMREAVAILQGQDNQTYPGGKERLLLDIRVSADTGKPELQAVRHSIQYLQAIQEKFSSHLDNDVSPDFSPLLKALTLVQQAVAYQNDTESRQDSQLIDGADTTEATLLSVMPTIANATPNIDAWRQLNIKNRADVDLALERICVYFENFEPSHPAPLLIRRVQKFMNMNFYDIMMDISPDSIQHLEVLIGKPKQDEQE